MADDSVSIPVVADTAPAQKALDSFAKETDKTLKSIEKSVGNFGDSFKSAAIKIGAAVASFAAIKKAVGEAVQEENAIRSLNLALAGTGEYSAEAAASMQEFAESLGDVTGLGDDAVRSALTLAKSFGITNDQAKQLVDAAADLSAVTGDDLDTAVRQLAGTFDGTIGKIGNLGADFRNLTADQLKNGDAIKLLNQRYGDAAESLGETFGASLSRLQNAFDDSFKEIGKSIIQDANIKQGLNAFAQGLKDLAPAISVFANIAVKTFALVAEGVAKLAKTVTFAGAALAETFGADDIAGNLYKATASLDDFSQGLEDSRKGIAKIDEDSKKFNTTLEKISTSAVKTGELTGKALDEAKKQAKELADEGAKFKEGIFSGFGDAAETENAKAQAAIKKTIELEKKGALTAKESIELRARIQEDLNKKIEEINKKARDKDKDDAVKAASEARAAIEKVASNPIQFFIATDDGDFRGAGVALASAFDKALSGRQGATQLFSSTIGAFADEVLPGIGGLVGSIINKLAAGPEQAKAFVKEFIDAIPEIIIAIVDALPEALSGIIEKVFSPDFLQRLGFAIGKSMLFIFTTGLSRFAPEWGQKIGEYILMPLKEGLAPIFERLAVVFQPFNDAANNLKTAFEPVSAVMQNLADALNNFNPGSLGGGGGIGGAIGGFFGQVTNAVSSALGFSQGGIVPMYAAEGAFVPKGTDTVPAMLTPGELVVPRDMVGELGAFLSAQNNTGGDGQAAMLAAILSAVQAPIVVKTEAKVNQNAFADIILQLNRQNARLAV